MSVTISGINRKLTTILDKLESSELIERLGADLAQRLSENSPHDTGATARALAHVGKPEKIPGGWAIGVGNGEAVGTRDQPAPRGTLRAFFDYLENAGVSVRYTDWRGLAPAHKDLLAQARRGGQFGGRGPDYANYMWVQNYGNAKARVTGTHFIEKSLAEFRQAAPGIIRGYFRE